jgi:hypothetical protein
MYSWFSFISYSNPAQDGYPFQTYETYQLDWPWYSYTQNSTVELIEYYANLLILQYIGKPKAYQTIETLVTGVVMDQLPVQVENGFQIGGSNSAVGVQLDVLGKYVGVTRSGYGPNGPITLDDADFTKFIQMAIALNSINSSLAAIQKILFTYFFDEIFVFDNQVMSLSYFLSSTSISLDLATLFITEGKLPKPLGVALGTVIYAPSTDLVSFFGMCDYNAPPPTYEFYPRISPLNSYENYESGRPFLDYDDALVVE